MSIGLISFLAAGITSTLYNRWKENRRVYPTAIGTKAYPQQNQHPESDQAFKRYVQSLYGKEYQPDNIQLRTREIAYQVSDAISLSYDYSSHYLLIKAYLETNDLPKESLRSRILGDDSNLSQVFMSTPYDAICIAMPPSCLNDNQIVTGIINRMESVWSDYATAPVEQNHLNTYNESKIMRLLG